MELAYKALMKIFDKDGTFGNDFFDMRDSSSSNVDIQKYVQQIMVLTQEKNFLRNEKDGLTQIVSQQKDQIESLKSQLQRSSQPAQASNDYFRNEVDRLTNDITKMMGEKGIVDR